MKCQILIADDAPNSREATKVWLGMLQMKGYELTIYEVPDGAEALRIILQHPKKEGAEPGEGLDLVITDMCMPCRTGLEVAIEGRRISPSTKFMVWSMTPEYYQIQAVQAGLEIFDKVMRLEQFLKIVGDYLQKPQTGS